MPLLGCIADDFTGGTDLGSMLVRGGMRCVQWLGVPQHPDQVDTDAIVVSLKTRSVAASDAVQQSLQALDALRQFGCERFFFKYCSTFDSTRDGNIGPVAEALLDALGGSQAVFCPAFPENGRTVYLGHLFVGEKLLSESGMQQHPLNPMTDANLVRVLAEQTKGEVGLVPYPQVESGVHAIQQRLDALASGGVRLAIGDAVSNAHLANWAKAIRDHIFATGGSAIAQFLAQEYRAAGMLGDSSPPGPPPAIAGHSAILAGSCSPATQRQVASFAKHHPTLSVDPREVERGKMSVALAIDWAREHLADGPVLIASTAPPETLRAVREDLGMRAAALVEQTLAEIACGLIEHGVRRLIVAGGETSGAVLKALEVSALDIGQSIDPGVPWTYSQAEPRLALALKSGNFGGEDFFLRALEMLS